MYLFSRAYRAPADEPWPARMQQAVGDDRPGNRQRAAVAGRGAEMRKFYDLIVTT